MLEYVFKYPTNRFTLKERRRKGHRCTPPNPGPGHSLNTHCVRYTFKEVANHKHPHILTVTQFITTVRKKITTLDKKYTINQII